MSAAKVKLLVAGSVGCEFASLGQKIREVNDKHGPFSACLCLGHIGDSHHSGLPTFMPSVPTYLFPNMTAEGMSVSDMVSVCGSQGLKSICGLQIVHASSISTVSKDLVAQPFDVAIFSSATGVDELIEFGRRYAPQYIFVPGETFHQHPPVETVFKTSCRILSIAAVGNSANEKWIYALSISVAPKSAFTDYQHRTGMSDISSQSVDRKRSAVDAPIPDLAPLPKKRREETSQHDRHCWFCLSSPEVEQHLVVSVGSEVYLALAKGPLVPEHVIILPISHVESSMGLSDACIQEIEKYKRALRRAFGNVVFFDRSVQVRGKHQHYHIQAVPLPGGTNAEQVCRLFSDFGASQGVMFKHFPASDEYSSLVDFLRKQRYREGDSYVLIELPDESRLAYRLRQGQRHALQFCREACARILNCPDRVDWKKCVEDRRDEEKAAEAFRKRFSAYDPMMT